MDVKLPVREQSLTYQTPLGCSKFEKNLKILNTLLTSKIYFTNLYGFLGQQKQFILPSSTINQGNQIIQIAGQNGQPNQMIIVPQGNIILLPSNNDQNGIKTLQGMTHICDSYYQAVGKTKQTAWTSTSIKQLNVTDNFSGSNKSISIGTAPTAATTDCYFVNA